ncbi:protein brambleberry-like [Onthophagus taurus]|uniref:protein brambleberry-like n=1 Tax=Onthophagus taurus TaxID=166361 RepID=UPI0039BE675B
MNIKLFLLFLTLNTCCAGIQDYFRQITTYFGYSNRNDDQTSLEGFQQKIPYEVSTIDEKFIEEAAKLTGVALSELDKCQQRIVLRLKKGCHEMNDEEVSKMAVMLLNCQSAIEERRLYPCNENMSIKECTGQMDADTWNAYHLMANRVRAVCYTARQSQFIGITEHTINRLLDTSRNQVETLDKLVNEQEHLRDIAQNTLKNVAQGNEELKQQQEDIAKSQFHGQLVIEDNIRRLVQEKELINESHGRLAEMTKNVQKKLEEATKQLEDQTEMTNVNHKELLEDLIEIQRRTQEIFERIDESSRLLLLQNQEAQKQYDSTMKQLNDVNSTVHSLVSMVYSTREVLEDKLTWISTALGGTDIAVDRLYLLLWHISFIVIGMIICAFLSCNIPSRILITIIPIANLTCGLYDISIPLNPFDLLISTFTTLLVTNMLFIGGKLYMKRSNQISSPKFLKSKPENEMNEENKTFEYVTKESSFYGNYSSSEKCTEAEDNVSEFCSPTPPLSRSGYYSSRSRSRTPLHINTSSLKSPCKALTRIGAPCKLFSTPGRDYCYKHQSGSSIVL